MSEHHTTPQNLHNLPAEFVGPYTTWKKKDGSGEDSNRHTYLLGENGKRLVISRAKFAEQFNVADEPAWAATWPKQAGGESPWWAATWPVQNEDSNDMQPAKPDRAPVREAPKGFVWVTRDDGDGGTIESLVPEESDRPTVQYWSGNKIYSSDPNRTAYSPTELPLEKGIAKEKSLRRKIGNKVLRVVASGALIFAPLASSFERDDEYNNVLPEAPRTEIIIEATPISTPDYSIVDEATPLVSPIASSTPESIATATTPATPEGGSSSTDLVEPIPASTPVTEVTPDVVAEENEDVPGEIIEPQSPPPTVAPESVEEPVVDPVETESSTIEHIDETEVTPEVESGQHEVEPLMVSVEVDPCDGITQVLAKVLAEAGYPHMTPEQLYELYEELVTNPEVGPDAIFVGISVEYNEAAGEYWIQGEGGVETHLTQDAAEIIQNKIAD